MLLGTRRASRAGARLCGMLGQLIRLQVSGTIRRKYSAIKGLNCGHTP